MANTICLTYIYIYIYIYIYLFIYLFIFGCVGSLLLCAGFLQLQRAGTTLRCGARASHCGGFSRCGAWALGVWASVVAAGGLSCSVACGAVQDQGSKPCPCIGRRILNHCVTRETLSHIFLMRLSDNNTQTAVCRYLIDAVSLSLSILFAVGL